MFSLSKCSLREYFIILVILLALPSIALAQSTTVSGQVTDSAGQAWNNGTYSFQFIPSSSNPNALYVWTGGVLNPFISGSLNATGGYSQSVPSTTSITPVGSQWRLQVCSGTTPINCFTVTQPITGGTQTINATPPAVVVPPGVGNTAYNTNEVAPAIVGSQIYIIGTGLQVCSAVGGGTCTTWGGSSSAPCSVSAKTSSYTLTVSDFSSCTHFTMNSSSAQNFTLPNPAPGNGKYVWIENLGTGVATVLHNSLTIDGGVGDIALSQNQGLTVTSNGTNYVTQRGIGGAASPGGSAHAIQINNSGTNFGGVNSPTANGDYTCLFHVTANAAVDPTCPQVGLTGRSIIGAATTDTVLFSDTNTMVTHDVAASGAVNQTLPTATTLGNPAFAYSYANHSAQTDTITPTTWTIQSGSAAAGATLSVGPGIKCVIKTDPNSATNWVADCAGGSGISGLTTGFVPKATNATTLTNSLCDEGITTANTLTCTHTQGIAAPYHKTTGSTAGFKTYVQGATSTGDTNCNVTNAICEQAPTAVTKYFVTKPGVGAAGVRSGSLASSTITEGISGDANHSTTVVTGSGTSIGSTSLCPAANCPAGTYRVNAYIDITTACTTTGTYIVNLIYTDDQASKTVPINIQGTGATPATGSLALSAVTNFGQASQILRSTGAVSINYSTTATACGSGGPMVGNLYLSVEQVQ